VLAQKVAALGTGLAIMTFLMIGGLGIGALAANDPLPVGDLFLAGLNVMAIAAFWGGVSLLISQFTITRRTASAIPGALIFGTYLLNNIFSTTPGLEWLAWLAGGFHFYSVSKPLVPGYGMQWGAWTALVAATAILIVVAGVIFSRRDIGSVFRLFERAGAPRKAARGAGAWLLGSVFGKSVRDLLWPTIFWAAGLSAYAALIVSTTNAALEPIRELLKNMQWLGPLVGNLNSAEAYLSVGLFIYFPVLLVVFSITQVISWTEDEEEGRLELPVSEPLPRIQHPLARYVATLLGIIVILAATGASLLLSAAAASVSLDSGKVVGALLATVPVAFVILAFGLCAATWFKRPGAAVPLTISIVIIMFFAEILGAILKLPEAALNVSVFHLYGRPLTEGVRWGSMLALTIASVVFLAGSLVGFDRRDIAK
jgi:ABC-2 type transport system permease protein